MHHFFSGSLPQGAYIVTELNKKEHTYTLPRAKTACFPFQLHYKYNQLIIDAANTTPFLNVYVPGVRAWPSSEPAGQSITASPLQSQSAINLPPVGVKWNFYSLDLVNDPCVINVDIMKPIFFRTWYWFNVANLQNKENYFYCKFTYHGDGIEYCE